MPEDSRLGQRLIDSGLISEGELEQALERQEATGQLLGQILVDMEAVEEGRLQRILADMFGIPEVSLEEIQPESGALDLIPQEVARRLAVFPLRRSPTTVAVVTPDPLDADLRDELQRRTGRIVEMMWASEEDVLEAVDRFYPEDEELQRAEGRVQELVEASLRQVRQREGGEAELSEAAPVVELIDELLEMAVRRRASDLHVEPREDEVHTRFRVDGVLRPGPRIPKELQSVVTTRLKIIGDMDISESRLPQDGRAVVRVRDEELDIRLSSFPVMHGESVVARLLQKERLVRGLEELGMTTEQLRSYREDVKNPHGIVLVTGPTGSGKTTTLYSTLTELDDRERNIMTIEDPVEYELEGIRQSQINVKAGLTFATGLRSILRQDPDVILVGEIRDAETMEIAVRSALTGHLVFSTLHTNDAAGAVPRLLNMGAEPFLLSSSLVGVLAQRLVRLLCDACREPAELSPGTREDLRRHGVADEAIEEAEPYRPVGCRRCGNTGFQGRVGIFEYLRVTPPIQEQILQGADASQIQRTAVEEGMSTMLREGLRRAFAGETTVDEVLRVAV